MQGKILFYHDNIAEKEVLQKVASDNGKRIADFTAETSVTESSQWGKELIAKENNYIHQTVSTAIEDLNGKDFLVTAERVLNNQQCLEYYTADSNYGSDTFCEQRHFSKCDLSGCFSGVKFRGCPHDILQAYDDIMELFGSLRVHMISISCAKSKEKLTAELQLEYDDYIPEKNYFTKIVNDYPALRMMAVSSPERKWENWFFFTSGGHSTSIKSEEIRYEHSADSVDYYWAKSAYFNDEQWLMDDFIFNEREKIVYAYPNEFNWSEILEFPSYSIASKPLICCASEAKFAKKAILPDSAKYINSGAFYRCSKLQEVVMLGVTKINKEAFSSCKALKKLVVSDKLISVDNVAFIDCGNFTVDAPLGSYAEKFFTATNECYDPNFIVKNGVLTRYLGNDSTIIVPNGVREIGELVFSDNRNIANVILPDSVESIKAQAFAGCINLTKVVLPEGLKIISDGAFNYCLSLSGIALPKSITNIGADTFAECESLTSIVIPDGVSVIEPCTFAGCKNLQEVSLPNSLNSIEYSAFYKCKKLSVINIPQGVTTIGRSAFLDCRELTAIDIPPAITKIEDSAFCGCKKLSNVTFRSDDCVIADTAFSDCRKLANKNKMVIVENILFDYFGKETEVVIPDGVIAISDRIFTYCEDLKLVTIPESVTAIGPNTFYSWRTSICAPAGSYAEQYAKENGIGFKAK